MVAILITYNKWLTESKLFVVKEVKMFAGIGLKEAKDFVDEIDNNIRLGKTISIGKGSETHEILKFLKEKDLLSFVEAHKTGLKKENHRVVAKRSKEYDIARSWFDSLHPKKQAMIQTLINEENGISG